MAFRKGGDGFILILVLSFACFQVAKSGDPDILTDFIAPLTGPGVDGNFFTYTGMRSTVGAPPPTAFTALKASMTEFPALNGQSVSYAFLEFPAGSVNPPHTHPRSAELLYVKDGSLEVGFIDTTNKLYTQTLQQGDMFVFPKGLVHFQFNSDANNPASVISSFGSANAGTVSAHNTLFATGIDSEILALAFKTDIATIDKIKAGLAPPPKALDRPHCEKFAVF